MKRGILLAAFGAGNEQSAATLRCVQAQATERFGLPVRWAFTSETLRARIAKARTKSDSVLKALERMRFERYDEVAVQSFHLIPGLEYSGVVEDARRASGLSVRVGMPLITSESDADAAADALIRHLPVGRTPDEPVVCMAHGSGHEAEKWYAAWGRAMYARDPLVHVACMKGCVTLDGVLPQLHATRPARVHLLPLLSVVGKHTLQDMAGAKPSSWKSRIEAAGFVCVPGLRGLADGPHFTALWLDKLAEALAFQG